MQVIKDMRIGWRLGAVFAMLLMCQAVVGYVGVHALNNVFTGTQVLYQDRVVPLKQLKRIADAYAVDVIDAVNKANAGLISARQAADSISSTLPIIDASWKGFMATSMTAEEAALAKEVQALFPAANQDVARLLVRLGRIDGKQVGQLNEFDGPLYATVDPISIKIAQLVDLQLNAAESVYADSGRTLQQSRWIIFGVLAGTALLAAWLAYVVTRSITSPLQIAVNFARHIENGDLSRNISSTARDEMGDLLRSMAAMRSALEKIVDEVRRGVESVTTASSQIAAGNLDLSCRTEHQASSLQETASSMEQLNSSVRQSSHHAVQASALAGRAKDAAHAGGNAVAKVIRTMGEISASSSKIAEITGLIDSIAFQTNILALNAAVEAARAGGQGRGFAVVAGEVRALAQRSAVAAREIKALIAASVQNVEAGSDEVKEAGKAMDAIDEQVREVVSLITAISASSTEQSGGLAQINQAVSQMDEVTQQNAALVEESAAAAASLERQARILEQAVSIFRVQQISAATC
ncbi:methyl-accepting chemotaxis protein [Delftia sp. PS-11]|uniref:methyl-accepting chemotaxis protein n=1 Tax=Delftia sp. PS-11 TaxID=2767222 RepID=UPI002457A5F3|nr:methyl-accepting chemotaxis protein [Delftia sp. PS-11]KAJ8744091.1 MCP four helix bundle domain-containing protein [Delftia sp. PS-11]